MAPPIGAASTTLFQPRGIRSGRPHSASACAARSLRLASSTASWAFLTTNAAPSNRPRVLTQRPATARAQARTVNTPRRPQTCRPHPTSGGHSVAVGARPAASKAEKDKEDALATAIDSAAIGPATMESVKNAVSRQTSHRVRAFHARATGRFDNAVEHYEKLVQLMPTDVTALTQLAETHELAGDLNAALATYRRVAPLQPDNAWLDFNMANLLVRTGQLPDAIAAYSRAIDKGVSKSLDNNQTLEFYRQRGAANRQNGDFEKAANDYAIVHATVRRESVRNLAQLAPVGGSDSPFSEGARKPMHCSRDESSDLARMMEIACLAPMERSEDDLLFLMDQLQLRFAFCANLRPELCLQLGRHVVASSRVRKSALLMAEFTTGTHVVMLARGRIKTYKTIMPFTPNAGEPNQTSGSDNQMDDDTCSWEQLLATRPQQEVDSQVAKPPLRSQQTWGRNQMRICDISEGMIVGFQGRFASVLR